MRADKGAGRRPRVRAALVEVAGLGLWLALFTWLHSMAGKDAAAAAGNALALQGAEHAVHLQIERGANAWLAAHPALGHAAVHVYRLYYVAVLGVLVWVFARHAEVYRRIRWTLVAMTVLVLPVYWAVPMSPPRFAMPGIVDIVYAYDIAGHASRDPGAGQTAMPSLHVGWALWCAYAAWTALRGAHPRLALLPWLFPLLMTAVVIGTGNHYVLDVAGSVALVSASVLVVQAVLGRLTGPEPPSS